MRDRKKLILACAALSLGALLFRCSLLSAGVSAEFTYELTFARFDSLLMGSCLALSLRGPAGATILRYAGLAFWIAFAFVVIGNLIPGNFGPAGNLFMNTMGYSLLAVAFASLIAWAVEPGSAANLLFHNSLPRWFGEYSYGIYVIHQPVHDALGGPVREFFNSLTHSKAASVCLAAIPSLAVTLVLAWLSFRFFESRFLSLKRFFPYGPMLRVHETTATQI